MRLNLRLSAAPAYRFAPGSGQEEGDDPSASSHPLPQSGEDLPYKVELWDKTNGFVEEVLAVASNVSIGYAAYYAAARQFPDRHITLRHHNTLVSRWNGPGH
jgi:hypothetical protein